MVRSSDIVVHRSEQLKTNRTATQPRFLPVSGRFWGQVGARARARGRARGKVRVRGWVGATPVPSSNNRE